MSLFATAYRLGAAFTVHMDRFDIIHAHPSCDGAAKEQASCTNFLYYTSMLDNTEDGVVMNINSTIMAQEVYLKALSDLLFPPLEGHVGMHGGHWQAKPLAHPPYIEMVPP